MNTSAVDEQLNKYFIQLTDAEKKSVLQLIKTFLNTRHELAENDIDEYNKEIDEAMEEVARGEFYTHNEVVNMAKSW